MTETAILAGGCFWCTEAIFQNLKGVISIRPGYTGGDVINPTYEQVCSGKTGHAEAIEIIFNPKEISFDTLLQVFFHTHDSTTPNQQGADIGTQYRSAIFYTNPKQKEIANILISQISGCTTEINSFTIFYPAENYHQNYFNNHSTAPYCSAVINPKLKKLLTKFSNLIKTS